MKDKECCKGGDHFVSIPASLAGIFLAITVLFLIFAKESLGLLIPLVWAFVVLGIVALAFAYKSQAPKKK
ncbi:hypothetical protein KY359_01805 [Candidatus Woesearchaeota archaeon]|nr:hypothetical protein [Candidatus Woesearchaeota archaeon]